MNNVEDVTLEGEAVEEILKEARRSKELAKDFGALAWQKRKVAPNKRFLNNTLVSTLRHSYREDEKRKDGSSRKFKQHMEGRRRMGGRNRFRASHESRDQEEPEEEEHVDYGEFDAIKYSEECTNLYIRDSHRKHARMKMNFVEKSKEDNSSDSDESFTEYGDEDKNKWKHSRYEQDWQDTGWTKDVDQEDSDNEEEADDSDQKYEEEFRKYENQRKKRQQTGVKASTSRGFDSSEHSEQSDDNAAVETTRFTESPLDETAVNSGTESAETHRQNKDERKQKHKKVRKLKVGGKDLLDIISNRSMYADIEELKGKGEAVSEDEDGISRSRFETGRRERTAVLYEDGVERRGRQSHVHERVSHSQGEPEPNVHSKKKFDKNIVKKPLEHRVDKEKRGSHKKLNIDERLDSRRDEETDNFWKGSGHKLYDRESRTKDRNSHSSTFHKHQRYSSPERSHSRPYDHASRETVQYKTVGDECRELENKEEEDMQKGSDYCGGNGYRGSGYRSRRPFRGRPFTRGYPFMRGRPVRGRGAHPFMNSFPMMPVMNPFYATLMQEFLHETGFENWLKKKAKSSRRRSRSSSRSSRSHSRSRSRRSRRKRRRHSSYSDSSRSRSRSRSRRRSRSYSRRRYSSSSYSSRSRSRSRRRSRSRSRDYRSRSGRHRSSSYSDRSRSRSRSRRSSRDRSRSRRRKRSHSTNSSKHSSSRHRSKSESKSESSSKAKELASASPEIKPQKNNVRKKKRKKSRFSDAVDATDAKENEDISLLESQEINVDGHGVTEYLEEETVEDDDLVASSGGLQDVDDSLENVSSDNGEEWTSEEEGEV